jgi:hypothetical protein
LGEIISSCEVSVGRWKIGNGLGEIISNCEVSEYWWKFVNWLVEFMWDLYPRVSHLFAVYSLFPFFFISIWWHHTFLWFILFLTKLHLYLMMTLFNEFSLFFFFLHLHPITLHVFIIYPLFNKTPSLPNSIMSFHNLPFFEKTTSPLDSNIFLFKYSLMSSCEVSECWWKIIN